MSLDLLNELEKRVQSAVNTIEELKLEIDVLKEENTALVSEKEAWEARLAELLGKFDLIESSESAVPAEDALTEDTDALTEDTDTLSEEAHSAADLSIDEMAASEESDILDLDEDDLEDFADLDLATEELGTDKPDASNIESDTLANQTFEQDFSADTEGKDSTEDKSFGYNAN